MTGLFLGRVDLKSKQVRAKELNSLRERRACAPIVSGITYGKTRMLDHDHGIAKLEA